MSKSIAVIGGGSWGTGLAFLLSDRKFSVRLWAYEAEVVSAVNERHENPAFLKGVALSPLISATASLEEALEGAEAVIFAVPSHVARSVLTRMAPFLRPGVPLVSASKGIEVGTLLLMTQLMEAVLPAGIHPFLLVLSGPSFAREVCQRHPTTVTLAAKDRDLAAEVQTLFRTSYFKAFTTTDLIGVQLGGALKNVIAIAAGGADGLGFGHNTRAALITRGLAEILRLGRALGADPLTFSGLSGLGDLVLTSTGALSRNRSVGFELGRGRPLRDILAQMTMVAEGIETTRAAHHLAQKHGVRMPIVRETYRVLFEAKEPRQAVIDLMESESAEETT